MPAQICLDYTREGGLAARPRRRLGNVLILFGSIYLAVMVLRYGLRMALYPPERRTGSSIPIFLHWVLATFLLLVGRDQRRRGRVSPLVPRGRMADGILRRSYPERGPDGTSALTQVTIDLWPTSMLFRPGHRIRLEVSSSNHPRFDPNPNVEGEIATQTRVVAARQAVHHGAAAVSRLILPALSRPS